jgi:hypothetical protein
LAVETTILLHYVPFYFFASRETRRSASAWRARCASRSTMAASIASQQQSRRREAQVEIDARKRRVFTRKTP